MTDWRTIILDVETARSQLCELEALLRSKQSHPETELRNFLNVRPQLIAAMGLFNNNADKITCWAPQVDFSGRHRCDYAVGDRKRTAYTLVELEDATPESIYEPSPATAYFTDRFNHGYSQIIDWLCQLDGEDATPTFRAYWGQSTPPSFMGLLIIGRRRTEDHHDDVRRLAWRNIKLRVNSYSISCMTYDDLVDRLRDKLDIS